MEDGQRSSVYLYLESLEKKTKAQEQSKYLKLYSRKLSRNKRKLNNYIKMAHYVVKYCVESYILSYL